MKPRTAPLVDAIARMGKRERKVLRRMFAYHEQQCAKAATAQPEGVAVGMHNAVDAALATQEQHQPRLAARVACRRGCAHCCHVNVDINEPEARLLIHAAAAAGHQIDAAHLRAQRDAPDFRALPIEARRCVFLRDDRSCAVYEHRPTSCRKYRVVDTPDLCDTVKHPGAAVAIFVCVEAEVIQSAAFTAWPAGSMARMLLQCLDTPDA